ncbi:MAG: methyl-accepting chemotaxis protein [Hungatella sp.]
MFKNLKIGKKLIVSFILVSIIASIASVVSVVVMKSIDTQYSEALVNYGFAQGHIGKALATFCRVDGNVHDAVSYFDETNQTLAAKNIQTYGDRMDGLFDAIEPTMTTQEGKDYLNTARTAWTAYYTKANELAALGATNNAGMVMKVQTQLVAELDPLYSQIYNSLNAMMDLKVSTGDTLSNKLTSFSNTAIMAAVILIIAAMAISLTFGTVISRGISRPMQACTDRLALLAHGDLTSPVPDIHTKDETGVLADATKIIVVGLTTVIQDVIYLLESMGAGNFDIKSKATDAYIGDFEPLLRAVRAINTNLSDTLSQINQSSEQVASGSDQVSSGAQALSQGATEQASSVEELAATINEISAQVRDTAANAKNANGIVSNTDAEITQSNQKMQDLIQAMGEISHSSQEIGKIIKTIEDIAFQTNILALNAAVEAARAGAAGKGFAVVADEVRNLASKSAEAAKGTTVLIEGAIKAVGNGTSLADETAKSLLAVVTGSKQVANIVDKISAASDDQASSIAQVTQGIDQISSVVQTNSATAEESAAASEELSGQAQMLKSLVGKFTLVNMQNASAPQASAVHRTATPAPTTHLHTSGSGKY